ncbi:response regulator transcription factor [Myroides odoratimimus]|uniref:response regulator transcription factor n=1 Tax=Myroides odoratimimus TaxID=76832 RepID=UPI002578E40A|nr:LuxR C-terminal-related transcriptional regulator [Myroides odoratimimus]
MESVLLNEQSTSYDKYGAYYLKYLTYKRVFSYKDAKHNLKLALKEGIKTSYKDRIIAQIKCEEVFIAFDLLEFDKVAKLQALISDKDLELVDSSTLAFWFIVKGTMHTRQSFYQEAEQVYDTAIEVLSKKNPEHLPLVYSKKIDLYQKMNEHELALESFEKGLFYSKQHNMDIYILNMYAGLGRYYKDIGDYKNAISIQEITNKLVKEYDSTNKAGRLNILETKIVEEQLEKQKVQRNKYLLVLFSIGVLVVIILGVIVFFLVRLKKKRTIIQQDNQYLRDKIIHATQGKVEHLNDKSDLILGLSQRQQEVLILIKKGMTNKDIANELFISENTVKYHIKKIYEALNINSRAEL